MRMPEVGAASARAPAADRIHSQDRRAIKRRLDFQRASVVPVTALLISLSCPWCAQGLVPWSPDDFPLPPSPVPTAPGDIAVQICNAIRHVVVKLVEGMVVGSASVIMLAFLMTTFGWAETDEQFFRRRLTTVTRFSEPEVDGDLIHRQDLKDEILFIVDTLKHSVLVWGSHKTGKSTLVETIRAEESKNGRPILYLNITEEFSKENRRGVLNGLFKWKSDSNAFMDRLMSFQMSSDCDLHTLLRDPKLRPMVKGLNRRPLFIIDNVNKLNKRTIGHLLQINKLFVDGRIGSFVFTVTGSGDRGRDFVDDSAMSRVKKLEVKDLSKEQTFQYLVNRKWYGGSNITGVDTEGGGDVEKIYEIVGGRFGHLETVQEHRNIEEFEYAMKEYVTEKINGVNDKNWNTEDTIRVLSVLSRQRPLCGPHEFYLVGAGDDRVEKMVEENLLQFNLDEIRYHFDSRLVEWYFENTHYREFVEV